MKESFVIFKSFYEPIKSLNDEELGKLFRAIFEYQMNGSLEVDPCIKMAFEFFRNQFRLDDEKYAKRCEKNKRNAQERWHKQHTNGCDRIQTDAKHADNDNDNEKDNDKDKHIEVEFKTPIKPQKKMPVGFKYPDEFESVWSLYIPKGGSNSKGDKWKAYKTYEKSVSAYSIQDIKQAIQIENAKNYAQRHLSTILNSDIQNTIKEQNTPKEYFTGVKTDFDLIERNMGIK